MVLANPGVTWTTEARETSSSPFGARPTSNEVAYRLPFLARTRPPGCRNCGATGVTWRWPCAGLAASTVGKPEVQGSLEVAAYQIRPSGPPARPGLQPDTPGVVRPCTEPPLESRSKVSAQLAEV